MTDMELKEIKNHYFSLFDKLYNESAWFMEMVDVKFNGRLAKQCDYDIHIAAEPLGMSFASGCYKGCFISDTCDWVVKIPFGSQVNSCAQELRIYGVAVERRLEEFFAEVYYLGEYKGCPVYAYPYAEIDEGKITEYLKADVKNYFSHSEYSFEEEGGFWDDPCEEIGCVVDQMFKMGNRLSSFINEFGICDLHLGNCGFINEHFVFTDYASN